jgi:hypothetical protein
MHTDHNHITDVVFERCHQINDLLTSNAENEARQELIKLLDFHKQKELDYSSLVNHLIRLTGLYPYLQIEQADWGERYIYDLFKVDVGYEEPITLHREQSFLLKKLIEGKSIAVSAPTSFGKSFVIDAFIKIKKPKNVVIIVPTIALTDETRRRIHRKFAHEYKIITTADVELSEKNIFIFPQERAISYVNLLEDIDILIVDEFYKASKNFDKERSPSLIKAMIKLGVKAKQKYYLAPNISNMEDNPFTKDMEFICLNFNTVYLQKHELYKEIGNDTKQKGDILIDILNKKPTKTLIYAGTYSNIDAISTLFISKYQEADNNTLLKEFANWLGKNYDYNWNLTELIKRRTGIHNGQLHRSLSQIQVKLFEEADGIQNIVSTSSIIEGVNTSAENVIIWMNKNGKSKLNDFTYKNIIGRGGRMFRYFIGNIFILDAPPPQEQTQLEIPFPEEILGDLDEVMHSDILTKEQVAKIKYYQDEMSELLGESVFRQLKEESAFQSSNAELVKSIAIDMSRDPEAWKGLVFLNNFKPEQWDHSLYKIINLQPGNWDSKYSIFVEFVKILSGNWNKSIPELLKELERFDVGINDFFKLERNVTFKFAALLKDVNTLQKRILKSNIDISKFIQLVSYAFLPPVVFQLEEYGLPRMISKKINQSKVIDLTNRELTIHDAINLFNELGIENIKKNTDLDWFDRYILDYFFEGIKM